MMRVLFALVLATSVTACGGGSKKSSTKVRGIFVHGDPMAAVTGTVPVTTSIFTTEGMTAFNDFNLYGGAVLQERSQPGNATTSEEGNEASSGEEAAAIDRFTFSSAAGGWRYDSAATGQTLAFSFTEAGGFLNVSHVELDKSAPPQPVEAIHYSVNPAKTAFSLLLKFTDPDAGNGLLALFFTKNVQKTVKIDATEAKYKYLLGPGLKAAWAEPEIKIDLCGPMTGGEEAALKAGVEAWATAGKIESRTLVLGRRAEHPPFSDVNARCAKIIDGFAFEDQEDFAVFGVTMSSVNRTSAVIEAGTILIPLGAFRKTQRISTEAERLILMRYVMSHEFGHYLGLDHEFSKGPDGAPLYPSVMSYEFDGIEDPKPRAHDREAIAKLYGP